jgi:hypothetical protein
MKDGEGWVKDMKDDEGLLIILHGLNSLHYNKIALFT